MASVPTETLGLTTTTPPTATPLLPFGPWADLPADLLHRVGDILHELKCYASARGTCAAWRRTLTPPTPSLLVVFNSATDGRPVPNIAFAASLPMRRRLSLRPVPSGGRWVGSSNGWLAHLALLNPPETPVSLLSLLNPVTGAEICLPALMCVSRLVSKIVFAVNTSRHDFVVVAMFDVDRLACIVAGDKQWSILDPVRLDGKDHLADLIYHEEGMVHCLTRCGDVFVVHLPKRRHGQTRPDQNALPAMVEPFQSLAHLSFDPTASSPPPYDMVAGYTSTNLFFYKGNMYQFPRNASFTPTLPLPPGGHHRAAETGPNPNAPLGTIEPLLSSTNLPFDPITSFAPPYDKISGYTSAKNLVSCQGNLYQIWRNTSCMVTLSLPGGGCCRVGEDEIFVLKYYPQRQPCWDAVTDLGGYSVFIGRNNAVSMYTEGVPGLKGDCVYWIGGRGRDRGMVFDMETKRSTPCLPTVAGATPGPPGSTICWYFLSDKVVNNRNANA